MRMYCSYNHNSLDCLHCSIMYTQHSEFYGEGPLRDKNGMCVPHEPNTEQKMLQDVLVILSQAISLIVMVDVHVQALLRKRGTTESTDS